MPDTRRLFSGLFYLAVGLLLGGGVTLAYAADLPPCDCIRPIERQPNGLPK